MTYKLLAIATGLLPHLANAAKAPATCVGLPNSAPNVERNCDTHRSQGASCRYSCPQGHSLMGPFAVHCLCALDGSACTWNSPPTLTIQCISWATSWPVEDSTPKTLETSSSSFNIVSDGLSALRALVGDDEINNEDEVEREVELELEVRSADNTCEGLSDPGHGGAWICTDSNIDGSTCDITCAEGYTASDESLTSQTCACETEEDGPIIIQLGCNWSQPSTPSCIEDEEFVETCIPLSAPENGAMECSDGFNEGTLCQFTCLNEPDVIMPDRSGKRRCKCREKTGCFWTRNDNYCGSFQIAPECDAVPVVFENIYTDLTCDDETAHGSTCEYVCAADFRLNKRGRRSRCRCLRRHGVYGCNWTKSYEEKWCVPAPRWYRKWNRNFQKAERHGDTELMAELQDEYDLVNVWSDSELSFAGTMGRRLSRKRRSSGVMEMIANQWW